jgi:hypothetical protein
MSDRRGAGEERKGSDARARDKAGERIHGAPISAKGMLSEASVRVQLDLLHAFIAECVEEPLSQVIGHGVDLGGAECARRGDRASHFLQVLAAVGTVGEVRFEARDDVVGQGALQVVGHVLYELPTDVRAGRSHRRSPS